MELKQGSWAFNDRCTVLAQECAPKSDTSEPHHFSSPLTRIKSSTWFPLGELCSIILVKEAPSSSNLHIETNGTHLFVTREILYVFHLFLACSLSLPAPDESWIFLGYCFPWSPPNPQLFISIYFISIPFLRKSRYLQGYSWDFQSLFLFLP